MFMKAAIASGKEFRAMNASAYAPTSLLPRIEALATGLCHAKKIIEWECP
jgi:hypothetical protein